MMQLRLLLVAVQFYSRLPVTGRLARWLGHDPAWLAEDAWRPEMAEGDLRAFLDKARGLPVEVILKDISTVRYQPQRLWEWEKMAMRVVDEYSPLSQT